MEDLSTYSTREREIRIAAFNDAILVLQDFSASRRVDFGPGKDAGALRAISTLNKYIALENKCVPFQRKG